MRVYRLVVLIFLLLLYGCKDTKKDANSTNELKVTQKIEQKSLIEKKEPNENNKSNKILSKLGIQKSGDGKIVIDPKKTKEFLEGVALIFANEAQKIKEKNRGLTPKELGVEVNGSKIIIDPKKGKNFLEKLSKELEEVSKDLKKSIDGL